MNELVTQSAGLIPATTSASLEAIKSNFGIIQQAMGSVLIRETHYGVVPGTKGKPSLLKAGADVLCALFHLSPTYEVEKDNLGNGHREYQVKCTLTGQAGNILGQGMGSSSTMEPKYRYRKAEQTCPECGSKAIIKGKKEFGGGWLCYKAKGGCGAKFKDGDERIENQDMGRIEHPDPAEYYNTCLKMAKKRAHVDAVLTVTGASAAFTQDLEDMRENVIDVEYVNEAPPAPTEEEIFAEISGELGLVVKEDFAVMKDFIRDSAAAKNKDVLIFAKSCLKHLDVFKKAFKDYLLKTAKPKEEIKDAPPIDDGQSEGPSPFDDTPLPDDRRALLDGIAEELKRLGQPVDTLPPDLAGIFGGDPGDIDDDNDLKALLQALKERK